MAFAAGLVAGLAVARPAAAQSLLERSVDLSGGWIGLPGMLQFDIVERARDVTDDGFDLLSVPTLRLALGLPGRTLVGAQYGVGSPVVPGEPDEFEVFGRYRPLEAGAGAPFDLTVQAGFNAAAESVDGEVALARWLGPVRLLAAARGFTHGYGRDGRLALAGGAVVHPFPGRVPLALAADVGSLLDRERGEEWAWGVGLQLGVPYTPNTLSLQVTNTATSTFEGASRGFDDVRIGFEITIPVPVGAVIGYYAPREVAQRAVAPPPAPPARVVSVPIRMYAFRPARLEIEAGTTVEWINEDDVVHTATADDASWNSGAIRPGGRWRATFSRPGVYPYHCGPHPYMKAVVIVRRGGDSMEAR
ncbi:MAG TPA: cupredoxin family copper-binding protein [Longimicrobiales bacterium]